MMNSTAAERPIPPAPAGKPEAPAWVAETPFETEYLVLMVDSDGQHLQEIKLARPEFIALKGVLAAMRGYQPAEEGGQE